jgi:hypothetical protein
MQSQIHVSSSSSSQDGTQEQRMKSTPHNTLCQCNQLPSEVSVTNLRGRPLEVWSCRHSNYPLDRTQQCWFGQGRRFPGDTRSEPLRLGDSKTRWGTRFSWIEYACFAQTRAHRTLAQLQQPNADMYTGTDARTEDAAHSVHHSLECDFEKQ